MKRRRYILPNQYPLAGASDTVILRTAWPLLTLFLLPPLAAWLWRGWSRGEWGWSVIGLLVSAGFGSILWRGLLSHTVDCNSAHYQRREQPVRYWLVMALWTAAYAASIAFLVFAPVTKTGTPH
jgi:hypothetical protein